MQVLHQRHTLAVCFGESNHISLADAFPQLEELAKKAGYSGLRPYVEAQNAISWTPAEIQQDLRLRLDNCTHT